MPAHWLRSDAHKGAVKEVVRGDSCISCHDEPDAEKYIGEKLVKAGRLEPTPVPGKNGAIDLGVQVAYDAKNAYFRFQWKTLNPYPGNDHQYLRFDGHEWKVYGYPKLDKVVQEGKRPGIHEDRMSIMSDDGYVLEFRNGDAGKDPFSGNADAKTHAPKFMWDAKKTGYKSITADQLRKGEHVLIREVNAVPFDPNAGWKEGDMVPDYVLSREDARGSAADNGGKGAWKNGMWTVVMTRPLGLKNDDDKALADRGVYNVGFAVHDDNITTRGHHVSFVRTLGFGVKADIQAVKLR